MALVLGVAEVLGLPNRHSPKSRHQRSDICRRVKRDAFCFV